MNILTATRKKVSSFGFADTEASDERNSSDDDHDYVDQGDEILSSDGEMEEYSDSEADDADDRTDADKSEVKIKPITDNSVLLSLMLLAWQCKLYF